MREGESEIERERDSIDECLHVYAIYICVYIYMVLSMFLFLFIRFSLMPQQWWQASVVAGMLFMRPLHTTYFVKLHAYFRERKEMTVKAFQIAFGR